MTDQDNFKKILPLLTRVGIEVTGEQAGALTAYGALLKKWNERIHLTGQRDRLFSHHILDCAMAVLPPLATKAQRAVDIGSGAGLPGVVLAVLRPELEVETLDTSAKKISFLQAVKGAFKLTNLTPRREDVRQWMVGEGHLAYDIAVSRAFARIGTLLPLGQALVRPGGEVWCFKGQKLAEEQAVLKPGAMDGYHSTPQTYGYDFPETGTGGVIAVYTRLKKPEGN